MAVGNVRCAPGYALADVRDGERRGTLLFEDRSGRWNEVERSEPGVCSGQAASHGLCGRPAADPALRRCSTQAFVSALRQDVDRLRFAVDRPRCRGDFASTRYTTADCLPEQREGRSGCERSRVAAWRRDTTRWRLITSATDLTCEVIRAAEARFPKTLCRRGPA